MVLKSSLPEVPIEKLNLSFSGCGFLGIYHMGVACCFREYLPQICERQISGASAGALVAAALACNLNLGEFLKSSSDYLMANNHYQWREVIISLLRIIRILLWIRVRKRFMPSQFEMSSGTCLSRLPAGLTSSTVRLPFRTLLSRFLNGKCEASEHAIGWFAFKEVWIANHPWQRCTVWFVLSFSFSALIRVHSVSFRSD